MKTIVSVLSLFVAQMAIADIQPSINDLSADDYGSQMEARNDLFDNLATISASNERIDEYQSMLSSIYDAIDEECPEPAKAYLIDLLGFFGDERSVAKLGSLLGHESRDIRERARKALALLPGDDASDYLMQGLLRGAAEERSAYMQALAYRKYEVAWEPIAALLVSSDAATQGVAAWALGQLGVKEGLAPLMAARADINGTNRLLVDSALLQIGPELDDTEFLLRNGTASSIRIGAFKRLMDLDVNHAAAVLDKLLSEEDFPARPGLIVAAIRSGVPSVQATVVNAEGKLSPAEKEVLVGAIADQRAAQFESFLVSYLESDNADLALAAADALGWVGSDASFEAMAAYVFKNLSNETVTNALARMDAPKADAYFMSLLVPPYDSDNAVTAVKVVEMRNSPGGTERLNEIVFDTEDFDLREAGFEALERVGDMQSIKNLLSVILRQDDQMRVAQRSLKRLSISYGLPELQWSQAYLPALESASDEQKESIVAILDGVAFSESLDYVTQLGRNPQLQPIALRTLRRWRQYDVALAWVQLSESSTAGADLIETAESALRRVFESESMDGGMDEKAAIASQALSLSTQPALKRSIAAGFDPEGMKPWEIDGVRRQLEAFKDDPDVVDLLSPLTSVQLKVIEGQLLRG